MEKQYGLTILFSELRGFYDYTKVAEVGLFYLFSIILLLSRQQMN